MPRAFTHWGTYEVTVADGRLTGVAPVDGEVVFRKAAPSAFWGTPLLTYLVQLKADTVLVCGVSTSGCVRASVVDAVQSGFPTLVVREAVGDRAQAPHDANLFDMGQKYADLVTMREAAAHFESRKAQRRAA